MDLNKKFSHLIKNSPRTLGDNPLERSENYRVKLERKTEEIDSRPDFAVDTDNEKEADKKKHMELLAEIKARSVGVKESILNLENVDERDESSYDILCNKIDKIEESTGWSKKDSLLNKGILLKARSGVARFFGWKKTNDKPQLKRIYSKLLTLKNTYQNDINIEEGLLKNEILDILVFEMKCADIAENGSYYELSDRMNGVDSFDKLENMTDYYLRK